MKFTEATNSDRKSRAKPRDLLCALTSNKGPASELASLNQAVRSSKKTYPAYSGEAKIAFVWREGAQQVPRLRSG
jgi:hypothetical protein